MRRPASYAAVVLAAALTGCAENPAGPTPGPGSCSYTLANAPAAAVVAAGVEFAVSVTTAAGCTWTASTTAAFISVVGAASGAGNGSVRFAVQANTGAARQGSIQIAGQALTVNQMAGTPETCDFGVSPTDLSVGTSGGDVSVTITINNGTNCSWTATANDAFISLKSGANGSGPGSVVFGVEANSGGARSGTITVAGRTVTIQQEGIPAPACAFSVSPTQVVAPASFHVTTITITVTQGVNCAWTAQSQSQFVIVGGAGSGVGSGSVGIAVADNGGGARTGTALVAGHTVTFNQVAGPSGSPIAVLSYQSEPGDWVGAGQTNTIISSSSEFIVQLDAGFPGSLQFRTSLGGAWFVTFAPPSGQVLAPGLYTRAYRAPFKDPSQPGLDVTGQSRGCNQSTGRFLISQAVFSGNTVQRFHAKFQQHCEGWSTGIRGELWIDAQGSPTPPPMADLPTPAGPSTLLSYQSEPGDYIGQGQTGSHSLADLKFSAWHVASQSAVQIRAQSPIGGGVFWSINMKAPSGVPLIPGTYLNATRYAFNAPGTPGLDVSGNGRGCNTLTGQFTVLETSFGPKGEVYRFRATFEQHCEGVIPALRGEILIVADPWK